jgi:hypothetical protein
MTMSASKGIFRTLLDAMIDARTREAERVVAYYRPSTDVTGNNAPKR